MGQSNNYLVLVVVMTLTACASWNPSIGMTYSDFEYQHALSNNWDPIRFVGAAESIRVYETDDVFYYFENGRLSRADQGQLFEQRIRVEIER